MNVFLQCKLTEGQHTGFVGVRAGSRDAAIDGTKAADGTRAGLCTGTAPAQLLEGFRVKSGWESWLYHVLDCFLVWFIVPAARLGVLCPRRCSNEEVLPLQDLCRCSQSSPQPMCPVLGRGFRQSTAHGRAPLKPAEPTQAPCHTNTTLCQIPHSQRGH